MTIKESKHGLPIVIDVEASGFGQGSYPIEVGFIGSDGASFCSLIKPQSSWTAWDPEAAKVHGLTREILADRGREVSDVANMLNNHLRGETVYSDAWGQDYAWLSLLFEEAGILMEFKLEALNSVMTESQKNVWHQTRKRVEQMLGLRRHRASSDARIIQMTYHWSDGSELCKSHHAALGAA
ncbi:hypothetical protein BTA51_06125 [Hahella sp. CCB-MM4]|uniref:3'-5' exonuclease n=1 Tax=Hahella sp. (strain CCB-MM4) TaxID=1926491 RepID=UPI000BD1B46E|nr:hypothetical protein [Hahella sp. CCB-MM4]OZG74572.1 hypothetical protein BTA51_06125 [Hahella sp. CCB-MM4]